MTWKLSTLLKIATLVVDKGELMDPGASSCLTLMIHPEIVLTVPSIFLVHIRKWKFRLLSDGARIQN